MSNAEVIRIFRQQIHALGAFWIATGLLVPPLVFTFGDLLDPDLELGWID